MSALTKLFRRRRVRLDASEHPSWQVTALEPRHLLAADVGAELSLAIDLRGQTGQERVEIWAGDYSVAAHSCQLSGNAST